MGSEGPILKPMLQALQKIKNKNLQIIKMFNRSSMPNHSVCFILFWSTKNESINLQEYKIESQSITNSIFGWHAHPLHTKKIFFDGFHKLKNHFDFFLLSLSPSIRFYHPLLFFSYCPTYLLNILLLLLVIVERRIGKSLQEIP